MRKILLRGITKVQLLVLNELRHNGNYATVTSLVESLSEKNDLAKSTIRWNIKQLVELGLIECGNSKNKGVPASLTAGGRELLKIIGSGKNG